MKFLNLDSEPYQQWELLVNHLQTVKKKTGLESSFMIVVPESNLAWEGIHQANAIYRSGLRGVCVMKEDDNRAGIKTNNDIKKQMAYAFKDKIDQRKVWFHKDFVCLTEDMTAFDMKSELVEQLIGYSRVMKESRDPYEPPKEIFSGKRGYGFDDMAIAIQLNLVMKKRFFNRPEAYRAYY